MLSADLLTETMEAGRQWNEILKVLKYNIVSLEFYTQ